MQFISKTVFITMGMLASTLLVSAAPDGALNTTPDAPANADGSEKALPVGYGRVVLDPPGDLLQQRRRLCWKPPLLLELLNPSYKGWKVSPAIEILQKTPQIYSSVSPDPGSNLLVPFIL
ncbi:hypothetical protein CPC08DRAFT_724288 [Agrocybe pediades]|nr:hypothetical protein CPC08DRAFT_724288 [Agrocybe pediades]